MASTRNRNWQGNYDLEQNSNHSIVNTNTYKHYGLAYTNHFASDGLLMGRMAPTSLAYNATDIESQLRGICSTNLTGDSFKVEPDFKHMESLSIIDRIPVILPEPLRIDHNQRPLPS